MAENAGSFQVTVTRTGGTAGTATVGYSTVDGTATAGQDYAATSGTLVFQPGETSKTITIPILEDNLTENPETLIVGLGNPTGATLASPSHTQLTITDVPPGTPSVLSISAASPTVAENAGSFQITVTRTGGTSGTATVGYSTVDGTATARQDYAATSGTLVFHPARRARPSPSRSSGTT